MAVSLFKKTFVLSFCLFLIANLRAQDFVAVVDEDIVWTVPECYQSIMADHKFVDRYSKEQIDELACLEDATRATPFMGLLIGALGIALAQVMRTEAISVKGNDFDDRVKTGLFSALAEVFSLVGQASFQKNAAIFNAQNGTNVSRSGQFWNISSREFDEKTLNAALSLAYDYIIYILGSIKPDVVQAACQDFLTSKDGGEVNHCVKESLSDTPVELHSIAQ